MSLGGQPQGRRRATEGAPGTVGDAILSRTTLFTVLGTLFPGVGLIAAGRRIAGGVILGVFLLGAVGIGVYALVDRPGLIALVLNPNFLRPFAVSLIVLAVAWVSIIIASHLALRPTSSHKIQRIVGGVVVALMAFVVAAPSAVAARYSYDSATLVSSVFQAQGKSKSATRPTTKPSSQRDPWAGTPRLNVLLLGGDSDAGKRDGVRTDTVMVASIDTKTGDTTLIGLPRNTERMPFPSSSPLHKYYPNSFTSGTSGDPFFLLNAMYGQVPLKVPKNILGETDNLGADVMKVSVGEAVGLKIDYYALLDIQGLRQLINALGGITVNINTRVAVGGDTDAHIPPKRWLEPGPKQHLAGYDAMWFARGRYGADDFQRMDRQRCVVNAIIDQVNPANIVSRYEAVARASKSLVLTDIPQELLPAFVDLALKVKNGSQRSVVFKSGVGGFVSSHPNYYLVQEKVKRAIGEATRTGKTQKATSSASSTSKAAKKAPSSGKNASQDMNDACAYHPG